MSFLLLLYSDLPSNCSVAGPLTGVVIVGGVSDLLSRPLAGIVGRFLLPLASI